MLLAVGLGQPADDHVGITDRLHLVHVVLVEDRVERPGGRTTDMVNEACVYSYGEVSSAQDNSEPFTFHILTELFLSKRTRLL